MLVWFHIVLLLLMSLSGNLSHLTFRYLLLAWSVLTAGAFLWF